MPTWPPWREVLALGSLIGLARFVLLDHDRYAESTVVVDLLLSALSGWVAAWAVLSIRHPPLPPTALVAVRPLHRAFVAATIRTCVAAGTVAVLAASRHPWFLDSPFFYLVRYSFSAGPLVAMGAFTEEALLGRRDWQAAAAGLFASSAALYVVVTQAVWVFAGTPSTIVGLDVVRTAAAVLLLVFPIAVVAGVRLRGAGVLAVSLAVAILTPLVVLAARALAESLEPHNGLFSHVPVVADLVVALPIAVRAGDLIGPGRVVND